MGFGRFNSEKGLTLVEVLAALVILGILFVGIMGIFPQMTLFNTKTETKLDTMNLARQEMAKVAAEERWTIPLPESVEAELFEQTVEIEMPEMGYTLADDNADFMRYTKTEDYFYEMDIYKACEPYWENEEEESFSCDNPDLRHLHKVHLKIYDSTPVTNGTYRLSSETFSYITFTVESSGEAG